MITAHQVRSVLALLNLLQPEVRLYKSDVDLREMVVRTARLLRPLARQRNVEIRHEGLDHLPRHISGDRALLEQLLFVLIDNAIKYSVPADQLRRGAHDGPVVIVDGADSRTEVAVVRVLNRGFTIAPQEVPRAFEMGFRGAQAMRGDVGGTGRGLFLAKRIVEAHGGEISYQVYGEEQLNVFTIALPASERGP